MSGRIDVHAHFLPATYREAAIAAGHASPDAGVADALDANTTALFPDLHGHGG